MLMIKIQVGKLNILQESKIMIMPSYENAISSLLRPQNGFIDYGKVVGIPNSQDYISDRCKHRFWVTLYMSSDVGVSTILHIGINGREGEFVLFLHL